MAASALLKNTLKKLFPAIKHSNLQGKNVFRNNYFGPHSFLYFTNNFVHLSVIAAACYFSVYKLIAWNPINIYFFKVISRNTRKRCPKLTINTVECRSGVLFVNFKHILHYFSSVSIVDFQQVNVFLV